LQESFSYHMKVGLSIGPAQIFNRARINTGPTARDRAGAAQYCGICDGNPR